VDIPMLARRARNGDPTLIRAGGARRMRAVGDRSGPPWESGMEDGQAPARCHPSSHTDQIGEKSKQEIVGGCPYTRATRTQW
jgi:hypothetical protein